ncbi:MAG: iron dependent repressor, metal binding and dimerization domain protein [Ndongobacter sp.]|nr:iron dependent repressor, metal binding and dimerization domain protein [Ndongobacter sp.]
MLCKTDKRKEEECLRILYLLSRRGDRVFEAELCRKLSLEEGEFQRIKRALLHCRCLEKRTGEELRLTAAGRDAALHLLERHQSVSDFLQLFCSLREEKADENARRMELTVDDEVLQGMERYMRSCRRQRQIRWQELYFVYERGSYEVGVGIYDVNKRLPRVLSREYDWFESRVTVEVAENIRIRLKKREQGSDTGTFLGDERRRIPDRALWYRRGETWVRAAERGRGYDIPAEVFNYTADHRISVLEADLFIAFTRSDQEPGEQDIREMNLHLW